MILPTKKSKINLVILLCGVFALLPLLSRAQQERGQGLRANASEQRLALVIGNASYKESALPNPLNDARDMAAALRACGFEVLSGEDQSQRQMKELIRQFGQKLRQGGVGLFYFAGHGVQVGGRNYLIPVGAVMNSAAEVEYEAVEAGFVLAQMEEARNRLNVVILDACRNNPYSRSFARGDEERGLASIRNAPSGTLIAYATAANEVASDGKGRNGLFTGELLTHLKQPGLTLEQVFRRTRTLVRSKSAGKQVPYEYSSVEGEDFYFIAPAPVAPVRTDEETAWNYAKRSRAASVVRLFLTDYPNSSHVAEARTLLAELEKAEKPPLNAPATEPVANPAANTTPANSAALTPVIALPCGVNPGALTVLNFQTARVDAQGKVTRFAGQPTQQYAVDLGGGVMLEMVPVQGYSGGAFWMGKYEVTQAQWRAVMGTSPSYFKGDRLPVEQVSWEDAQEFCRKLNAKLGLSGAEGYRLPREAEWEYAARAGTKTEFAFGVTISPEIVNYDGKYRFFDAPKRIYREKTVKVGSLGVANGWGLYEMHGNVWEWCEDLYAAGNTERVLRGGSWHLDGWLCRSANRGLNNPDARVHINGFRVVSSAKTRP